MAEINHFDVRLGSERLLGTCVTGVTKQVALSGRVTVFKTVISMEVCAGDARAAKHSAQIDISFLLSFYLLVSSLCPGCQAKNNPDCSLATPGQLVVGSVVCLLTQQGEALVKCQCPL